MKLLALLKRRFVSTTTWARDHFDLCLFGAGIVLLTWLFLFAFSCLVGFWLNGLFGFKFEIMACVTGIGAITTGVGTLWVTAKGVMDKYRIDSELNSKQGEKPDEVKK